MSAQPFEIRCPRCGSVVPAEASGCTSCAATRVEKAEAVAPKAVLPEIATMRLKDYHRLVKANYSVVEGPRVGGRSGSRLQAYLPFVLLLLGLLVGAAMAFGRL
jgi:hypothetical protein